MLNRRQFAASAIAALAASSTFGCARRIEPICLSDPRFTFSGPLTIDAHVHVFNATDLQVKEFLLRVLLPELPFLRPLGSLIQHLSWAGAPTADAELRQLEEVRDALQTCDANNFRRRDDADFERGYRTAITQLDRAYRRARNDPQASRELSSAVGDKIEQLKATPAAVYRQRRLNGLRTTARSYSFDGGIDLIIRNFQYRYVNVLDYLKIYSAPSHRKFDLIVPALVDYDWPIAKGHHTRSSLASQVRVMAEITRITGGRVHSFVPYDPFKRVAFKAKLGETENPLDLVQSAIDDHGFLGVKLYPTMGFKPLGNSGMPDETWDVPWLAPQIKIADLGRHLDDALKDLYRWCLKYDVPILAHTNQTNYPAKKDHSSPFKDFVNAGYWKILLDDQELRGLRINLGHFGNAKFDGELFNSSLLAELMTSEPESSGEYVFADSSYFNEIVDQTSELQSALRDLYRATANSNKAPVAQRLMYGSDWEMLEAEGRAQRDYFLLFQKIYAALDREPGLGSNGTLSDDFFGLNAANFLGLHEGMQARSRLDTFYMGSRRPIWMRKVDGEIV